MLLWHSVAVAYSEEVTLKIVYFSKSEQTKDPFKAHISKIVETNGAVINGMKIVVVVASTFNELIEGIRHSISPDDVVGLVIFDSHGQSTKNGLHLFHDIEFSSEIVYPANTMDIRPFEHTSHPVDILHFDSDVFLSQLPARNFLKFSKLLSKSLKENAHLVFLGCGLAEDRTGELPECLNAMHSALGMERVNITLSKGPTSVNIFPALKTLSSRIAVDWFALMLMSYYSAIVYDLFSSDWAAFQRGTLLPVQVFFLLRVIFGIAQLKEVFNQIPIFTTYSVTSDETVEVRSTLQTEEVLRLNGASRLKKLFHKMIKIGCQRLF